MKNSTYSEASYIRCLDQHLATTVGKQNESCITNELNKLSDSVSHLKMQLQKAEGDDRFDILTSIVDCDLKAKEIIHIMLEELILELKRVHRQGYDIAEQMDEAGHPFSNQFYESLTGYELNRRQLMRMIQQL